MGKGIKDFKEAINEDEVEAKEIASKEESKVEALQQVT